IVKTYGIIRLHHQYGVARVTNFRQVAVSGGGAVLCVIYIVDIISVRICHSAEPPHPHVLPRLIHKSGACCCPIITDSAVLTTHSYPFGTTALCIHGRYLSKAFGFSFISTARLPVNTALKKKPCAVQNIPIVGRKR